MLIKQIFKYRRPVPPSRLCTPITGCFHDKKIILKENNRLDCNLPLEYCTWQCTLFPPKLGQITYKIEPQNARF